MANVTFTANHQPAPACYPSDVNGLLDIITSGGGVSGTIPDTAGGGVFVGSSAPSSALTNKVWYKTDGAGRPLGVYMFYNGNWRKVYTGVGVGQISMFWYYSGLIDGTGRGVIGGDMDGWALCNGQNGTPNLQGYFPVCGEQGENVGQTSGEWFTDADGVAWRNTGGQKGQQKIQASNLPALNVNAWAFNLRPGFSAGTPGLLISPAAASGTSVVGNWPINETQGSPNNPLPFPCLYFAIGFFMFVGYQ